MHSLEKLRREFNRLRSDIEDLLDCPSKLRSLNQIARQRVEEFREKRTRSPRGLIKFLAATTIFDLVSKEIEIFKKKQDSNLQHEQSRRYPRTGCNFATRNQ